MLYSKEEHIFIFHPRLMDNQWILNSEHTCSDILLSTFTICLFRAIALGDRHCGANVQFDHQIGPVKYVMVEELHYSQTAISVDCPRHRAINVWVFSLKRAKQMSLVTPFSSRLFCMTSAGNVHQCVNVQVDSWKWTQHTSMPQ